MITDDPFRIFRIRTAFRFFGFAIGIIYFYLFGLVFFRTGIPAIIYVYIHFGEACYCRNRFRIGILHDLGLLVFRDLFTFFAFPGREIHIVEELFLRHCAQRQRTHNH
jgi:hypothetical protein